MKFKKILVPMDGSNCASKALDAAIDLAKETNGSITAVYVLPFPAFQIYEPHKIAKETFYVEGKKLLESAKSKTTKNNVKFEYQILQGHTGDAITDYALSKTHKMDVIVMGHRGRSKAKEVILGSVANYVLHKTRVPVLIVK